MSCARSRLAKDDVALPEGLTMNDWRDYELTIGMPHMVPNRLSEVELLKCLGAFQWASIATKLGRQSRAIVNVQDERLYASFVNVELSFPRQRSLDSFEEGASVGLRNRVTSFARRFVEGLFVFDTAPLPAGITDAIATRDDLARSGRPWAYMTNAFVARAGSNSKLKVFEPAGMDAAGFPSLLAMPSGIAEHQTVQGKGLGALPEGGLHGTLVRGTGAPLGYRILPESDLNGAGLLYFARYVAIANYGVRRFMAEQLARPVSNPLLECLCTEHLRIYYFVNADAFDSVRIFVRAGVEAAPTARFSFHVDLYRESDGVLMASCLLEKALNVPGGERGLVYEAERLLAQLEAEANPSGGGAG